MLEGCRKDVTGTLQCCGAAGAGTPAGCRRDAAGMQEASCRTLSHSSFTSKECLALKLTQTSHFISPETFRRKQVLISLETQAADAGLPGRNKQLL